MTNCQRMRVTQVLLRPSTGGVTEHVLTVTEGLIKEGVSVTVAADWRHQGSSHRTRSRFDAVGAATLQVPFPDFSQANGISSSMRGLSSAFAFYRHLLSIRPDIVHVHWRAALPFVASSRILRIPTVFSAHNTSLASGRLNKLMAKIPNISVVNSKHLEYAWLRNHGVSAQKVSLIPNGVFQSTAPIPEKPEASFNQKQKLVVCTVARIEPGKGHADILRAISQLKRMGVPCELLIAGDGTQRQRLEELAQDLGIAPDVYFLDWQDDVTNVLLSSHCFVLMSEAEAFPLSVVEAMAYSVVPIRTRVGGAEQIVDGESGFLVDVGDHRALAARLRTLDHDRDKMRKMSQAARNRWQKNYTSELMVERISRLYREIASSRF